MNKDTSEKLEEYYQTAIQHAKSGEYDIALEYVSKMQQLSPDNDKIYLTSAAIKMSAEDYYGCYKDAEKCVMLNNENASGWNHVAVALCELGHIHEGLKFFKTAISLGLEAARDNYEYWSEKV